MRLPRILSQRLFLLFLILWPTLAFADFQAGLNAYDQGDYTTAVKAWQPLAEAGNGEAQTKLASLYFQGLGVPQDYAKAAHWSRLAADQGDAVGQGSLGSMYFLGTGVPQDYIQAHMWLNLAAAQGDRGGQLLRDKVVKEMTFDQLTEAQHLATEWLAQHQH
jgi:TPR repeat protein